MLRRAGVTSKTSAALGGAFWLVVVLLIAVVAINVANRPATAGPVSIGADQPAARTEPTAPAAAAAVDPFEAKCARLALPMTRAFTEDELIEMDARARARGGSGNWLVDGGKWETGQLWIGSDGDLAPVIAAYGGARVERAGLEGGPWIAVERDGQLIAITLQRIDLPSGLVLWAPHNFRIPVECPPGA